MIIDVDKLLKGRLAIENYQSFQATADPDGQEIAIQNLISELKSLEFDSIQDFYDYNEYACYYERVRCFEKTEDCDECSGRLIACYPVTSGKVEDINFCSYLRHEQTPIRKSILNDNLSLEELRKVKSKCFFWRQFPNEKPPGCSIVHRKVDELRFDIYWGMSEGLDSVRYDQDKLTWQVK